MSLIRCDTGALTVKEQRREWRVASEGESVPVLDSATVRRIQQYLHTSQLEMVERKTITLINSLEFTLHFFPNTEGILSSFK